MNQHFAVQRRHCCTSRYMQRVLQREQFHLLHSITFMYLDVFAHVEKKLRAQPKIVTVTQDGTDDAAGVKKPLRFACLSCDKPVVLRPLDAIPALPSMNMFPSTRSFRPYTTYELELIRRHHRALVHTSMHNMYLTIMLLSVSEQ